MGGEVSTDFKSSNGIEISRLVQVLLNFDWFWGVPPWGVGGWVELVGGGEWVHPTHMHMHMHAHTHIWHHREFPGIPPMGVAICMKLSCLPHMHVHVCMCVHVHMCGGHHPTIPHPHPPTPQPPSTPIHPPPTPEPQGTQNTKIEIFNSVWRFGTPEPSCTHID